MKFVVNLLAVAIIGLCCSVQASAWSQAPNDCITANEATTTVDCYYNGGFAVNFKFSAVKAGTNFIRIYQGRSQGSTFTYPFKTSSQTVSSSGGFGPQCFTIDVYDVLPNGKVVKCSSEVCVPVFCGFEFAKDVVAGEMPTTPSLTLAPNPAMDVVNISVAVPSYDPNSAIELVDMTGNMVATLATGMAAGTTVIPADLPNLSNGVYMVRMLHVDGMVVQQLQIVR